MVKNNRCFVGTMLAMLIKTGENGSCALCDYIQQELFRSHFQKNPVRWTVFAPERGKMGINGRNMGSQAMLFHETSIQFMKESI